MNDILTSQNTVLVVDDDPNILKAVKYTLTRAGIHNIKCCMDSIEAQQRIREDKLDLVLLDLKMPNVSSESILHDVLDSQPEVPVIILTGDDSAESAAEYMKKGAYDYIVKSSDPKKLTTAACNAIQLCQLKRENETFRQASVFKAVQNPEHFADIVTNNAALKHIFLYIENVATTPYPILLTGETGVGKELFAKAIHKASKRKGDFVAVNVAGLDDSVFSDTLFGHKKGAYTGAVSSRQGLIASAQGGTLFLDEIGDLSHASQVKLLRLLQEQEYMMMGEDKTIKTDARVILATNADLLSKMETKAFRSDLYYRINTHKIHVPALRERMDDIVLLVDHFLAKAADRIGIKKPTPPHELVNMLSTYHFPGNVRELEGMIANAVSCHKSHVLSMKSFKTHMQLHRHDTNDAPAERNGGIFGDALPMFSDVKRLLVQEAVKRSNGSYSRAAERIGTTRQAVWRLMKD